MGYNQSQLVFYQWTTKNGWFSSGSLQPIGKQNALGDLTSLRSQFWSDTSWACGQRATSRFPEKHRGTSLISGEKTPPFVVHFPDGNHVFFCIPQVTFWFKPKYNLLAPSFSVCVVGFIHEFLVYIGTLKLRLSCRKGVSIKWRKGVEYQRECSQILHPKNQKKHEHFSEPGLWNSFGYVLHVMLFCEVPEARESFIPQSTSPAAAWSVANRKLQPWKPRKFDLKKTWKFEDQL